MDFTYTKNVLLRLLTELLSDYTAEEIKEEIEFELEKIKMLEKKVIPVELPVSKILAGYDAYLADSKDFDSRAEAKEYVEAKQADGKITNHIRYYSMEMSSKYMLIVYEDENDNQYFANSGLAPNRIKKVGTAGTNLIYMVVER